MTPSRQVSSEPNRLKVVYILDRFPADTLNFVYNEIEVLDRAGFDIDIFSLLPCKFCPAEAEAFRRRTIAIKPVPLGKLLKSLGHYLIHKPLALMQLFFTLPWGNRVGFARKFPRTISHVVYGVHFAYLLRNRQDHIHAHFAFKATTSAYCASKLNGATYSFTAHGSASIYPPHQYSFAHKVRGADFIVAISEYNKRMILKACPDYPEDQIVVNRTGIVVEDFPFNPSVFKSGGPFRILCVASLFPIKNHECLIDACGLLAAKENDFKLSLVGKGESMRRSALEARAEALGILERITFHGVTDHAHIAEILRDADLVVLTSHSEGIPVAMMEAMAVGVPVLGPRVTGLPELITENVTGWLADPSRPMDFAQIIGHLMVDPQVRAAVLMPARKKIESDFDMKANAQILARIFKERIPR